MTETPRQEKLILALTRVNPSTQVCAAQGDAQMFKLLAQYYALVASEVATAGGRVIKVMGDSTLLTFPPDSPHEAVQALLTMQTKTNEFWRQVDGRCEVQVKVGIGTIVSGMLGSPGDERFDVIGSGLNSLMKAPWSNFETTAEIAALLT